MENPDVPPSAANTEASASSAKGAPSAPASTTPRAGATREWWRVLPARWGSMFWLKSIGTPIFMAGFFMGYFAVLRATHGTAIEVPYTFLDRWIGFQPWTLVPYLSLWLYVSLPSSLIVRFWEIASHTIGCALLGGAGLLIFRLWPTTTPVPGIAWENHPQFQFIKTVDAGGNACPSLHVAFAVFAALWLARILRRLGACRIAHVANIVWAVLIVYSTIATRQHVAIDVFSGALLGWIFARINLFFTPEPVEPAHTQVRPAAPPR